MTDNRANADALAEGSGTSAETREGPGKAWNHDEHDGFLSGVGPRAEQAIHHTDTRSSQR